MRGLISETTETKEDRVIDFWVMSNFGLVLAGLLIILYTLAFLIFRYLKTKVTKTYMLMTLRVILVLFPLYLVAVWVVNGANVNSWPTELSFTQEQLKQYTDCEKKYRRYAYKKNPWLFEIKYVALSDSKVLENPECLGLFINELYMRKEQKAYQIYEQVEEIKTVRDNGFVEIEPIGKNLIMTIKKEPKYKD